MLQTIYVINKEILQFLRFIIESSFKPRAGYNGALTVVKALTKQEGPSVFAIFFLNLNQLPIAKKDCKNRESQKTFSSSYFVMALQIK